jgi:putative toxin-antitoxin system antitoxin component (TIGR02293 family)
MKSKKNYKPSESSLNKPKEDQPKSLPIVKDFTYSDFKKVAAKTDFTQKEWSDILHISERTLQRYAKDNNIFSFSVTDRILLIDKVLKRGHEVFGSYEKFLLWIRDNPYQLEGRLSLHSLASFEGINNILIQLGRIEHGIFA